MSLVEHVAAQRTEHGVPHAVACRALGVAPSTFYEQRGRPASIADAFIEWPRRQDPLDAHHISETIISFAPIATTATDRDTGLIRWRGCGTTRLRTIVEIA